MTTSAVGRFHPASPELATERFDVLADIRAESPVAFVPAIGMWAVTGHDEIREVLAAPARFRSGGSFIPSDHLPAQAFAVYPADGPLWRYSMVSSDGEQHRRLRGAMSRAFTARRVNSLEPVITADAEDLLRQMFADGSTSGDLFAEFARPLPSRTIARFFGLAVQEAPRFSGWSDAFVVPLVPGLPVAAYVHAAAQFAAFDAYLREIVTGDLRGIGDGIIRSLVEGKRDGSHDLTEDELVGDIANVVFAGHETTVSTLSNIFVRLLRDRDLWGSLADGSVEIDPLVEELLRLDTSGIGLFRVSDAATRLGEVDLPAQAKLWVSFGGANRDPAVFDDPDRLMAGRSRAGESMTFGRGVHGCIGAALARAQVRIAVSAVPAAFPTLTLSGEVPEVPNYVIRATPRLPVTR
ncbi:MAG: cytochrome P450 [Pseudonocardia sp.]|nr:cytochrome P450 [Pseudonocardia sp.]